MAGKCSSPKGVAVKSYDRAKPRRKAKTKAGTVHYVVRNDRGHTLGTKHKTRTAAVRARQAANRKSYRAGLGQPWDVVKVTA